MMRKRVYWLFLLLILLSCAAPITMVSTNEQSLAGYQNLIILPLQNDVIGEINEDLTNKVMKKASQKIVSLKRFQSVAVPEGIEIKSKNENTQIVDLNSIEKKGCAQLETKLLEYNKGSAFLRFMFGVLAGSGEVTIEIVVIDHKNNLELRRARTTAAITGAFASESQVVDPLAKAIEKFVKENFRQ